MPTHKLLLLPGDGIGPEVMAEVGRLIDWLNAQGIARFETEQGLVGGSASVSQASHEHVQFLNKKAGLIEDYLKQR